MCHTRARRLCANPNTHRFIVPSNIMDPAAENTNKRAASPFPEKDATAEGGEAASKRQAVEEPSTGEPKPAAEGAGKRNLAPNPSAPGPQQLLQPRLPLRKQSQLAPYGPSCVIL